MVKKFTMTKSKPTFKWNDVVVFNKQESIHKHAFEELDNLIDSPINTEREQDPFLLSNGIKSLYQEDFKS